MTRFIFLFLFLGSVFQLQGQSSSKYSRIRIDMKGKEISTLSSLGIETDHGLMVKGRYFENDFSEDEIRLIHSAGFETKTIIADIQQVYADNERSAELFPTGYRFGNCLKTQPSDPYDYETPQNYQGGTMGGFLTYDEMLFELDKMASFYPDLITVKKPIGDFMTTDSNRIWYVKISDFASVDDDGEDDLLYTALHHAREPNSMSQMIFYMWYLLENYATDAEIKRYVDNTEMYFIPCVNPDGYRLNEKSNPNGGGMWRKNSKRDADGKLIGVDLNRNYGYFWGYDNDGSSPNPNSETYRGEASFSEVETQAVKFLCETHQFKVALNYHTFGNLLIHPWGYNDLPTEEDHVFKVIGKEMNKENNFSLGTGTETVGYITNGDSDDYMYGEQSEKNKIYSFTPEVGPSFWPSPADIDYLNKSCVNLNLSLPRVMSNYTKVDLENQPIFLNSEIKNLNFSVRKVGFKNDPVKVTVSSDKSVLEFEDNEISYDLNIGDSASFSFNFNYRSNIENEELVPFYVTVFYDDITRTDTLTFTYLSGEKITLFSDKLDTDSNWKGNGVWALTNLVSFSPTTSMTDSPSAAYSSNVSSYIELLDTLDLSDASYAEINYEAKWSIEDGYDYVQVMASADGVNYEPLCGLYTNAGTADQKEGEPLYDGNQPNWVAEKVSLEDFVGSSRVLLRFTFRSDGFLQQDGFYFDDFKVNVIRKTSSQQDLSPLHGLRVIPNPANEIVKITGLEGEEVKRIRLINLAGITVADVLQSTTLDVSRFENGLYFIQVTDKNNTQQLLKLIIQK